VLTISNTGGTDEQRKKASASIAEAACKTFARQRQADALAKEQRPEASSKIS